VKFVQLLDWNGKLDIAVEYFRTFSASCSSYIGFALGPITVPNLLT
jgi:hypothetical protein